MRNKKKVKLYCYSFENILKTKVKFRTFPMLEKNKLCISSCNYD